MDPASWLRVVSVPATRMLNASMRNSLRRIGRDRLRLAGIESEAKLSEKLRGCVETLCGDGECDVVEPLRRHFGGHSCTSPCGCKRPADDCRPGVNCTGKLRNPRVTELP